MSFNSPKPIRGLDVLSSDPTRTRPDSTDDQAYIELMPEGPIGGEEVIVIEHEPDSQVEAPPTEANQDTASEAVCKLVAEPIQEQQAGEQQENAVEPTSEEVANPADLQGKPRSISLILIIPCYI